MFRVKTTRKVTKRAISPLRPATDPLGAAAAAAAPAPVAVAAAPPAKPSTLEKSVSNFFEAESASVALTRPWLRLDRGMRLQKFRAYADSYPGLSDSEKERLYRLLIESNDAKLLNTKQQITYEDGCIQAIRGLKVIRTGDVSAPATFKIDATRNVTKRHTTASASAADTA
jgi:hypothetical protein